MSGTFQLRECEIQLKWVTIENSGSFQLSEGHWKIAAPFSSGKARIKRMHNVQGLKIDEHKCMRSLKVSKTKLKYAK